VIKLWLTMVYVTKDILTTTVDRANVT